MDSASSDMSVEDATAVQQDLLQSGGPVNGDGMDQSSSLQPVTTVTETTSDDVGYPSATAPSSSSSLKELISDNLVDPNLLEAGQPPTEAFVATSVPEVAGADIARDLQAILGNVADASADASTQAAEPSQLDPPLTASADDANGATASHLATEDYTMNGSDPASVPASANGVDSSNLLQVPELATISEDASAAATSAIAAEASSVSTPVYSSSDVIPDASLVVPTAIADKSSKSLSVEPPPIIAPTQPSSQELPSLYPNSNSALPPASSGSALSTPTKVSSLATDPDITRQTANQLLALRKPQTLSRLAKLRQRVERDRFDGEAWLELVADAAQKGDLEKTRETYEGFFKAFPDNVRYFFLLCCCVLPGQRKLSNSKKRPLF